MSDDNENTPVEPAPHLRTVRSFVIRGGRVTDAQQRAMEELWPRFGAPRVSHEAIELNALFGRVAPVMMEIGFGAGEALLSFARAHPEFNCLGVEVHPPGVGHLLLSADAASLTNARVVMQDAVEVLEHRIPAASISLIHIFFPDPWPKKRHHKRRLIQPPFVELLARVLEVGGTLRLATDWEPYAVHMREVIDASTHFLNSAGDAGFVSRTAERPLTRFERRGQRLGHSVWELEYRKKVMDVM